MRDRPLISSETLDVDRLMRLKRGTLGREYVEWLRRGDVTPDTREPVSGKLPLPRLDTISAGREEDCTYLKYFLSTQRGQS